MITLFAKHFLYNYYPLSPQRASFLQAETELTLGNITLWKVSISLSILEMLHTLVEFTQILLTPITSSLTWQAASSRLAEFVPMTISLVFALRTM